MNIAEMAIVPGSVHHRLSRHLPVTESALLPPDVRDYIMPSSAVLLDTSRMAIRPHACPKCSGPMILIRIRPARIGFESRTFHGVNCNHIDKVVTETQSMKWMSSGLQAPV